MSIIRFKNYVPEVYVAESRDFQVFTSLLDFTENAIKFDIDSIIYTVDTDIIPSDYIERLKAKVGFFTSHHYPDDVLRFVLSAFPYIMKYKGSKMGIVKCVHTFLKIYGINGTPKIDIYNDTKDSNSYTVQIGINSSVISTQLLEDMLRYVLPTGYFFEIYFYTNTNIPAVKMHLESKQYMFTPNEDENTSVRGETINGVDDSNIKDDTYNTLQLGTIFTPTPETPTNI